MLQINQMIQHQKKIIAAGHGLPSEPWSLRTLYHAQRYFPDSLYQEHGQDVAKMLAQQNTTSDDPIHCDTLIEAYKVLLQNGASETTKPIFFVVNG